MHPRTRRQLPPRCSSGHSREPRPGSPHHARRVGYAEARTRTWQLRALGSTSAPRRRPLHASSTTPGAGGAPRPPPRPTGRPRLARSRRTPPPLGATPPEQPVSSTRNTDRLVLTQIPSCSSGPRARLGMLRCNLGPRRARCAAPPRLRVRPSCVTESALPVPGRRQPRPGEADTAVRTTRALGRSASTYTSLRPSAAWPR